MKNCYPPPLLIIGPRDNGSEVYGIPGSLDPHHQEHHTPLPGVEVPRDKQLLARLQTINMFLSNPYTASEIQNNFEPTPPIDQTMTATTKTTGNNVTESNQNHKMNGPTAHNEMKRKDVGNQDAFLCDSRETDFKHQNNLTTHMQVHTEETVPCLVCGKQCTSRKDLKEHTTLKHNRTKLTKTEVREKPPSPSTPASSRTQISNTIEKEKDPPIMSLMTSSTKIVRSTMFLLLSLYLSLTSLHTPCRRSFNFTSENSNNIIIS